MSSTQMNVNKLLSRELLTLTNACGATNLRHNWSRGKMCRSDWTRQDLVASTTPCTRRYQTLPPPTKGLARETRLRQRLRFQQKSNVVWRGPPGWSFTYLCHRCYDKVAYPSRYDTSWLELSPDVGHFVYRRKRDKREVKRDSGT